MNQSLIDEALERHIRPAGAGWAWIRDAWRMFTRQVVTWLVLVVLLFLVVLGIGLIPLGDLLTSLLSPVLMGGLMLGAHRQAGGGRVDLGHLFAGFRRQLGPLVLLGLLQLLATIIGLTVLAVVALLTVGLQAFESPELFSNVTLGSWILLAVVSAVFTAGMVMAFWLATPLVAIAGCKPWESVERSFEAALRNWRALLVYGAVVLGLLVVATIPLGLGLIVLLPVLMISNYTACADIFAFATSPATDGDADPEAAAAVMEERPDEPDHR